MSTVVLMYHHIAQAPGFYTVPAKAFEGQMRYISANFEVVDIATYVKTVKATGRNKPRQVAVTFDDAYQSYGTLALPIMSQYSIPSALFVSTGFLGKSNEWDIPEHRQTIMTESELQATAHNPLVTIGAHSKSHPSLAQIQPLQLTTELSEPKEFLESLLKKPIEFLAYPFGQPIIDVNKSVMSAVQRAGYLAAFSTNYGITNRAKDCFALHRIEVGPQDDLKAFAARFSPWQARYFRQRIKNVYHALKGS